MQGLSGCKKTDLFGNVTGFGTGSEKGNVYIIPESVISDGKSRFLIHNLSVISILKTSIGCDLLISETMFSKADTTILRREKREIQIVYDDRKYYCTPLGRDGTMTDLTIWAQRRS